MTQLITVRSPFEEEKRAAAFGGRRSTPHRSARYSVISHRLAPPRSPPGSAPAEGLADVIAYWHRPRKRRRNVLSAVGRLPRRQRAVGLSQANWMPVGVPAGPLPSSGRAPKPTRGL